MKCIPILTIITILLLKTSMQRLPGPHIDIRTKKITISFPDNGLLANDDIEVAIGRWHPKINLSEIYSLELKKVSKGGQIFKNSSFKAFSGLAILTIKNSRMNDIPESTFQGLNKLKELGLYDTELKSAGANLFKYTSDLRRLDLINNTLEHLPSNIFANLTQLHHLEVKSNKLKTLATELFQPLNKLITLFLSNNLIERLEDNMFATLKKLYFLDLSFNNVSYIDENVFKEMHSRLMEIHMTRTFTDKISSLPPNLFSNLSHLTVIKMAENHFQYLHDDIFRDQKEVVTLDLSFNKLTDLGDKIFEKNVELKTLNLSNNKLTHLSGMIFMHLSKLNELKLDNNQLSELDSKIFFGLTHLGTLNISYNQVDMAANYDFSVLKTCINITNIYATNNNISEIYKDWRENSKLKVLDLRINPIPTYETNFEFKSPKVKFHFTNNVFEEVQFDIYQRKDLSSHADKAFSLDKNSNCSFDDSCSCYGYIFYNDKNITIECERFNEKELNEHLPPPVTGLSRNNNFKTEFRLSNCSLTSIFPVKKYLQQINVTTLVLSSNKLSSLSDLPSLPALKELYLHDNNFTTLDKKTVDILNRSKNLKNITLHQNPWFCDCAMIDFYNFMQSHEKEILEKDNITCVNMKSHKSILKHQLDEFCLIGGLPVSVIWALFVAFACAFAFSLYFFTRYELEIKVWLFSYKPLRWLVSEKELDRDKTYDAFISYASQDEWFVKEELVPKLENGEHPYKLCIHLRDWRVGEFVPTQIHRSVEDSRRTIIVLTPNFLNSFWGKKEFQAAYIKSMKERCPRILIILLEDIGDMDNMDDEMKAYIKVNTYLEWSDPWFWQKLKYALPHKYRIRKRGTGTDLLMD